MRLVFGVALLFFACSYASGEGNKDIPHPPANFVPGEVKPPATSQSDSKVGRRGLPKAEPTDKNGATGGIRPKGSSSQQGR
jgi:hypothetical protein